MDEKTYHWRIVVRGAPNALIVGDMPFGSYFTIKEGMYSAGRSVKEGGVGPIKLEARGLILWSP